MPHFAACGRTSTSAGTVSATPLSPPLQVTRGPRRGLDGLTSGMLWGLTVQAARMMSFAAASSSDPVVMARQPRTEPTFDSVRRVCLPASVGTMAAGELGIAGVVALLVVTVVAAMVLRGSRTQRDEGAAQSSGAALPPAQGGPLSVASANSRTARHPVATLVMKTSGLLALLPAAWWVVLGTRWATLHVLMIRTPARRRWSSPSPVSRSFCSHCWSLPGRQSGV